MRVFMIILLLFLGCSKEVSIQKSEIKKDVSVLPFVNFTKTKDAGYKVASILEGVLKERDFKIKKSIFDYPKKEYSLKDIQNLLKKSKNIVITGYVNEYRYKMGVDAIPAVSITIKAYDPKTEKFIFTSTISEVGSSYDSLSVITQKALKEIFK